MKLPVPSDWMVVAKVGPGQLRDGPDRPGKRCPNGGVKPQQAQHSQAKVIMQVADGWKQHKRPSVWVRSTYKVSKPTTGERESNKWLKRVAAGRRVRRTMRVRRYVRSTSVLA